MADELTPYAGSNMCADIDTVINQVRQALTDEAGVAFQTLAARLTADFGKAVSGYGNITGDNVATLCNSNADNLPNNKIYGVSISTSVTVSNFPARSGQMVTFGTGATRSASGDFQVFIQNTGDVHYRSIWNGTWSSWSTLADAGKTVSGYGNITGDNVATLCNSNADNLPNNKIYGVSIASGLSVTNFPARNGQMVTFGTGATRSNSGDFQVFFQSTGEVHYRTIWNGTWSDWRRIDDLSTVVGVGNLTGSNVADICDSDADNMPNNRIYGVSISTSVTVSNFPARSGQMITFGTGPVRSNSGDSQVFIQNDGTFYFRSIWNGTWSDWKYAADGGKAVSGALNITGSNVADICNSDANNLPNNRIYGVSFSSNVTNFPARSGQMVTFGTGATRSNSGDFQVFIRNDGALYYRSIWNGTWSEWFRTGGYWAVAGGGNITGSNVATICSNDANNLPNNRIYGVSISTSVTVSNFPARSGQMITFGNSNVRSNSGDSQFFIQNTGTVYYRSNWNGVWSSWHSVVEAQPVKILTLGDSIARGDRNSEKGFVGDLGFPYKNIAVSGARLSYEQNETYKNIPQQLIDETEYEPDAIVANGGINDYIFNFPLGTLSSRPVANDTEAAALDKTTVTGGAEYLFYNMIKKYPFAHRFFLIVHKVQRANGDYYPTMQNTQGYTQQDLHDRLVAVCKLYNVRVIDVYEDGMINTIHSVYRSDTRWLDDPTTDAYVDIDGLHPDAQGYLHGYVPLVKKALLEATVK